MDAADDDGSSRPTIIHLRQQLHGMHRRRKRVSMKNLFKALTIPAVCFVLIACTRSTEVSPSPIPSPTGTLAPTITPSPTATATLDPTPKPEYVPPTLIPTIDPTLVPGLLNDALSVQTLEGVNGYQIQQIIGWDYGFGTGVQQYSCPGFDWLDTDHLALYPAGGQINETGFEGTLYERDVVYQPAIINLETGAMWLPPVEEPLWYCNLVAWSQELGILINFETPNGTPTVSIYTYDGRKLASHTGQIANISPSGTKIFFEDNTLIDLRTNKTIKLDWSLDDYNQFELTGLFWTSDEKRVYRCCYFYADLTTGVSYRFERSDFQDTQGNHLDPFGLLFHQGEWVRDNKYFLVHWLAVDDGPVKDLPMLDPGRKLFYDVWKLAGISPDLTWRYNEVSPDGNHVWVVGFEGSYLVNLTTFESQYYPHQDPYTYAYGNWSADSKFVWFQSNISDDKPTKFQILSIWDGKSSHLPVVPLPNSDHWWHPTKAAVIYPAADKNALIFLDTSTMSYRELPFNLHKLLSPYGNVVWNPKGEKLALVAEDGGIWQVDYPKLENLEQLTPSLPDIHDVKWSPDGISISFISGSDIYIVDVTK